MDAAAAIERTKHEGQMSFSSVGIVVWFNGQWGNAFGVAVVFKTTATKKVYGMYYVVQGWATEWTPPPGSWLSLAKGGEFTQPRPTLSASPVKMKFENLK